MAPLFFLEAEDALQSLYWGNHTDRFQLGLLPSCHHTRLLRSQRLSLRLSKAFYAVLGLHFDLEFHIGVIEMQ